MKLLYCEDCGDILAPYGLANKIRPCRCGRHTVWWVNPHTGELRLNDRDTSDEHLAAFKYPRVPRAYVIGITNSFLGYGGQLTAEAIEQIIESHPSYYLFKQVRSCIIRIRPGESSDTAWAPLPAGAKT